MPAHRSLIVRAVGLVAAVIPALAAGAQQAPAAGALPAIRPLSNVRAASADLLGAVSQVRALPDGRVLVNDNLGRKVVLYDAALKTATVVADTTSATANAYSSRAGGLIAYRGDSTLFVDPTSLSMLVIDPKGQVTRVMSVPRPNDAQSLIGGPNGTPGFDGQGRLVYRGSPAFRFAGGEGRGGGATPAAPESLAVVRIALDTRKVDTVAYVRIQKQNVSMAHGADGRFSMTTTINPLPVVDDWTVTSDGRVCIVRGQDYRMDWFGATSNVAASSKIPFAWKRLNDSSKAAIIDSTKAAMEVLRQQALARAQAGGGADPAGIAAASGMGPAVGGGGGGRGMFEFRTGGGGDHSPATHAPDAAGPQRGEASGGNGNIVIPPLQFVSPSDLPDYAPPFTGGSVRGDMDGNVWIRTTNTFGGGSVYDIVNAKGELTDRVLLPPGRVIAGFGKGVVYTGVRDGTAGVRLEVAPIRGATP